MGNSAAELLGRVAGAGGRLLHVERAPLPGPGGAQRSARLRLVFDLGVVELRRAPDGGLAAGVGALDDPDPALLDADEEEPWWALLGHPLTRVSANPDGSLGMQLRRDEDAPKWVVIAVQGPGVTAGVPV
jgi:hypothetical protein